MPFRPSDSNLKITAALEEKIHNATSNVELIALLHEAQIEQRLVERDPADWAGRASYYDMHPVEQPVAPFTRTLNVNGTAYTISAATPELLERAELEKMREIISAAPAATGQTRDEQGRFTRAELNETAESVIDGNVDPAATAISKTVTDALAQAGVDVNALREFTHQKQGQKLSDDWAQAAVRFGERHPEFPHSEENKNVLATLISENNLVDDADKLDAMERCYQFAKENEMFSETKEQLAAKLAEKIAKCTDQNELRALIGYTDPDAHINDATMWKR